MFAAHDRNATREVFFRAWQRHLGDEPLAGAERLIVAVALRHPEYHAILADPERYRGQDYVPEMGATNPFLHLGLHVAIEEQLGLDQPHGVLALCQRLRARYPDEHDAQHRMMECLAEMLWRAGRGGGAPDAAFYLDCLARHAGP